MATDVNLGMLSLEELRRLLGQTQAATPSSQVGVSPYQRIMAQMTPAMNPYIGAGQVMGGYDPSFQGGYDPGLYSRLTRSSLINTGGGGGGGGDMTPTPSDWDKMTNAEKAAFYAANPTMAAITQLGQKAFEFTSLGALQRAMQPDFVNEQSLIPMGVDPAAYQAAKESFRASEINNMNAAANAAMAAASNYGVGYNSPTADGGIGGSPADADPGAGGYSGSVGADYSSPSDGGIGGSPADADPGAGGYGNNDSSYGGFYNMGGLVDRVGGPNPAGPDDGAGMLQLGEYVIKKSAVNKYGTGLLDMINAGKIPAKKMKSLLG